MALTGDDRATIFGTLLWIADKLKSDQANGHESYGSQRGSEPLKRIWRHARKQIELFQAAR